MNSVRLIGCFCVLGFLAACSTPRNVLIEGHQFAHVEPDHAANVALLLDDYRACDQKHDACDERGATDTNLATRLEECIARGLDKTAPRVTLVTDEQSNVDYFVRFGIERNRSDRRLLLEGASDSSGALFAIGREWTDTAKIHSRIFSADDGSLVGELSASLAADGGWFVPVLLVVPLPPVGWSSNVETHSCNEMGEALGRFFSGAGNELVD